jgi:hypothetical protein
MCLFLRFSCFICVDTTISVVTRIPWAKGLRDLQTWMAVMSSSGRSARCWFGILFGTWFCQFVTVCVSFGCIGLYSFPESTLPKETMTRIMNGQQWLDGDQALSESGGCARPILLVHVA